MGSLLFLVAFVFFCAYSEGCEEHCGSLPIPYPFGIGSNCSLEESFDIKCNYSTNPPRAYLATREEIEIIEITPLYIRVMMFNLLFSSFHLDGKLIDGTSLAYDFSETAYSFSSENWFTTIGCSDMAIFTGYVNKRMFTSGCISFCSSRNVSGGAASCPFSSDDFGLGIGCCRALIPRGTTIIVVDLLDAHENWGEERHFHGTYAFVGEKASNEHTDVQYRLSDLDVIESSKFLSDSWTVKHMPSVVLDWRITGAENCSEAMKNPATYACQAHSECVEFQTGTTGYLCKCSEGYHGNPYLASGCQ